MGQVALCSSLACAATNANESSVSAKTATINANQISRRFTRHLLRW